MKKKNITVCDGLFWIPMVWHSSTILGREIHETIMKGHPKFTPRTIFTTNKAFSGRAKDAFPLMLYESKVASLMISRAAVGRRKLETCQPHV